MKILPLILALLIAACGGEQGADPNPAAKPEEATLTAAQIEHGVGPITAFDPGPLDAALADSGLRVFTIKCSACHKMDERYVGPPLRDVANNRSPAYIMNMILNPDGMTKEHPAAKEMFAQYMSPMPNQHLSEAEARAVLEYLRHEAPTP